MSEQKPTISFEDFAKVDLRVGVVEKAEAHPSGDKLLVLTVDFGPIGKRTICAGIREYCKNGYSWLEGNRFIFCVNLAPRKMRGIESQGMILAASNEDHSKLSPVEVRMAMLREDRPIKTEEVLMKAGDVVG